MQALAVECDAESRPIWQVDETVFRERLVREQPAEVRRDLVGVRREVDEFGDGAVVERVLQEVRVDRRLQTVTDGYRVLQSVVAVTDGTCRWYEYIDEPCGMTGMSCAAAIATTRRA